VYDVTDETGFNNVDNWIKQVDLLADQTVCKILVGNKCDVDDNDRKVKFDDGEKLAKEINIPFFETSAKDNINVTQIFDFITKQIMDKIEGKSSESNTEPMHTGRVTIHNEVKSTEKLKCLC